MPRKDEDRLAVARHAAALFWQHGVDGTSGDAIAAAAGISKRTVWRYFRSKEACVEPLFVATGYRFIERLRDWPRAMPLEAWLGQALTPENHSEQDTADALAAARLVSLLPQQPALRSAYLMASAYAEEQLLPIIAERSGRAPGTLDVRMCAATVMAAVRVVDQDICTAAITHGQSIGMSEVVDRLAAAIRAASTLEFCDPVPG